jgi:signal transduction histidine kinase
MILDVVVVALATLLAGLLLAFALRRLPTVRLQLAGLALVAVALPLAAVLLSGMVMFHMGDALSVAVVSVAAAAGALVGALLLERNIVRRLERVRGASVALASGDLGARAPTGGPAELAELATSFNTMAGNVERIFDARRELVAWASHDLRAPVTSLQAMLEAIEDKVVAPEHYLGSLQSQVRLLGALVDDLFELACIDAGALTLELVVADLVELLTDTVGRHDAEARARSIELGLVVRDTPALARCAPGKVERVVTNLIDNALRYTPPGGRITVSVTAGAGSVLVSVEDTGVGIAPEVSDRVFEPFWRGDAARTPASGGAGLGLAIARGLIEAQGGRIWAEPPVGGGTRVCFALLAAGNAGEPTVRPPGREAAGNGGPGDGLKSPVQRSREVPLPSGPERAPWP